MLSNPNVRALALAILPAVSTLLALLQQDADWKAALIGGAATLVTGLVAMYGTPLNKSVGVGKEALNADGEPVQP